MESARPRPSRPPPPNVSTCTNREVVEDSHRFLELYQQAVIEINEALGLDEEERTSEALASYKKGVQLIEGALAITLTSNHVSSDLRSKRDKLTTTLENAKSRIQALESPTYRGAVGGASRQTALPTYDEAISPVADNQPIEAFGADVLLEVPSAQIFFITGEGYVSSPSYPNTLSICKFNTPAAVPGAPQHFLLIGNFTLPLVEGLTPSLQATHGSYIFPDVTSTEQGAAVGILLDDETPADTVHTFEAMIASLSALRPSAETVTGEQVPADVVIATAPASDSLELPASRDAVQAPARPACPPSVQTDDQLSADTSTTRMSTKISSGLVTAADWINWGLGKGAEKVGSAIAYGGEKLRRKLRPTSQERELDEQQKKHLAMARYGTHVTLQISAAAVKALGDATIALGRMAAPHIKAQAKKLLPSKVTKPLSTTDESGRSKADDIIEVAGAGVKGLGVIYVGLEEAAKALGRSLATQTGATVSHRYGQNYGQAAESALYTTGNALLAAHNITQLGPKAIAKKAAKNTAKAVVTTPRTSCGNTQDHRPSGDIHTLEITELPPDSHAITQSNMNT